MFIYQFVKLLTWIRFTYKRLLNITKRCEETILKSNNSNGNGLYNRILQNAKCALGSLFCISGSVYLLSGTLELVTGEKIGEIARSFSENVPDIVITGLSNIEPSPLIVKFAAGFSSLYTGGRLMVNAKSIKKQKDQLPSS